MEMSSLCRSRSQKWRFPKLLSLCWWSRVSKAGERLFGCTHEVWEACRDWSMGLRDGDNSASNSLHHCVRSHHHHQLGVLRVAQCHARLSYWIPRCPSQPCSPLPAVIVNLIGTSPKHSTLRTGEHSGRDWRNIFTTFPLEFSCMQ